MPLIRSDFVKEWCQGARLTASRVVQDQDACTINSSQLEYIIRKSSQSKINVFQRCIQALYKCLSYIKIQILCLRQWSYSKFSCHILIPIDFHAEIHAHVPFLDQYVAHSHWLALAVLRLLDLDDSWCCLCKRLFPVMFPTAVDCLVRESTHSHARTDCSPSLVLCCQICCRILHIFGQPVFHDHSSHDSTWLTLRPHTVVVVYIAWLPVVD